MPQEQEGDALLLAVEDGNAERVMELLDEILAERPNSIDAKVVAVLHAAAENNQEKVLARLLEANQFVIQEDDARTALSLAAKQGHGGVVALMLDANINPLLTAVELARGETPALHRAAENGHEAVFAQLLSACPESIDVFGDEDGLNVLHCAVSGGHDNLATQILNVRPELAKQYTREGWCALCGTIDSLLKTPIGGDERKLQLMIKLFEINSHALYEEDVYGQSPFMSIHSAKRKDLIEVLLWRSSLDDLAAVGCDFHARYRPLLQQQCESLVVLMNRDVLLIIFEYIGFNPIKRISNLKRPFLTPPPSPKPFKCPVTPKKNL